MSGALTDLALISFGLLALLLGVVGGLLVINRASQRQTAEIALTQSRLQAIISTSLDAILVAGKDGRVLDFNGAAEGIFGYSRDEAIGADMADLIIPDHMKDAHNAGMERYRKTGEKRVVGSGLLKLEAKRKDGTVFPSNSRSVLRKAKKGRSSFPISAISRSGSPTKPNSSKPATRRWLARKQKRICSRS